MPSGLPPFTASHHPTHESAVVGPTEVLAVGQSGLIALPRVSGVLSFSPPFQAAGPEAWRSGWERWVADWFVPVLAPALSEMAALAAQEKAGELRAADLALAGKLSPEVADRLSQAGRLLLNELRGTRSTRWSERFRAWVNVGETPALFPTIFAGRAALFHLPPRPMLAGYARLEWRGATTTAPDLAPPTDALESLEGGFPPHPKLATVAA